MKRLSIKRISKSPSVTMGALINEGIPFCLTLEPPWLFNKEKVSCIPNGVYRCKRITSPKYGETFEITGVPDRSHILFHWGNVVKDTEGCVIIGQSFGKLQDQPAVLESKKTFTEFNNLLKDVAEFILEVE